MNFKTIKLIGVLVLISTSLFGQEKPKKFIIKSANYDQFIGIDYDFDGGGSALKNAFLSKFLFGGYIDNELKNNILDKHSHLNFLGKETGINIFYRQENREMFGMNQMGFQVEMQWKNYLELDYTKDLFQLIFFGNTDFLNKSAILSETKFSSLNYYQIKAGLNRYSSNKRHYFLFNLALNLGNDINLAIAKDAYFYSSENGDSIALEGNLNYNYIKSTATGPHNIFGFGAGMDLIYKYKIEDDFRLEAEVKNLGFIRWNKKHGVFDYNKPIIWEGIEIENILQLPNPILNTTAFDSVNNFINSNSYNEKFISYTPVDISIRSAKYFLDEKFELEAGIKYRFFSNFKTQFDLQANFKVGDNYILSPSVSYGGYTKFNIGFGATLKTEKGLQIKLETKYLSGLIFQQGMSGIGGFINFTQQI